MAAHVPTAVTSAPGQSLAWLAFALPMWFITSILFNYLTPQLLALVANQDVTFLEFSVVVGFGAVALSVRGLRLHPPWKQAPRWLLVGVLHLVGCRFFIWGLQFIPVSLAQTIRASSPMLAVPIGWLLLRERYSVQVLMPLLAILFGFGLSVGAGSGDEGVPIACAAALGSVCCMVLVNGLSKGLGHHPFEVQFWIISFALVSLLPFWVSGGGPRRMLAFDGDLYRLFTLVLLDGGMYYIEQVLQNQVLAAVPFLAFAVIDTLRRLCIVCVSGFLIQGNTCTMKNALGIVLVLLGAIVFNLMQSTNRCRSSVESQDFQRLRDPRAVDSRNKYD